MAQGAVNRELLFGVLALRADFITRDALNDAMSAWALDKSKPLAQVLIDQGALDPRDRAALEPMVDRHVERHGGDVERSLTAVTVPGPVRDGLRQVADPEIVAALDQFSTRLPGWDSEVTASWAGGPGEANGVRYRVLRPHAKGGIGEVSVALDAELNREVALKQILADHADDPASRARFILEAEVTGRLEHPGVVPVYGLGRDAVGRPFYAMRFVKGDSFKEAIAGFHKADKAADRDPGERTLALRQLLGRFIDVCHAVGYAHSRGVLHRDLKPANILLGPYGETLVVDWGLAKVIGRGYDGPPPHAAAEATLRPASASGSGSIDTVAGSMMGTPSYMSPEQAEGRIDELSTTSDLYSLGAVLYCLLTGRPPVEGRYVGDVLRRVREGDFPPPRTANRRVSPALEAICLKVMALRPSDRYGSARALSEELEHWLADEPVAAYREPPAARAGRWVKRHRTLVVGAGALLVTAVIALSAGAALLSRANARTADQRRLAEENFRQARLAVDDYLTTVSESTLLNSPLPGLQPLRKELLEAALHYYQDFVRLHADDPTLRGELAASLARVGEITAEVGSSDEAARSLRQAEVLYERLARDDPSDWHYPAGRGRTLLRLAKLQLDRGQAEQAIPLFEQGIALTKDALHRRPQETRVQADLALGHQGFALLLLQRGDLDAARQQVDRAIEIEEQLVRAHPDELAFGSELGRSLTNVGQILQMQGKTAAALGVLRRALEVERDLVRRQPAMSSPRLQLSKTLRGIAVLSLAIGDWQTSRAKFRESTEVIERLVAENPAVTEYRLILATSLVEESQALVDHDELDDGLGKLTQAREQAERVEAADPDSHVNQYNLASIYRVAGKALGKQGKLVEALESLRKAIVIDERFATKGVLFAYNLACDLSLSAAMTALLTPDMAVGGPEAVRRGADRAMEALRRAVRDGWTDRNGMDHDPDLDAIRDRDDFRELMRSLGRPSPADK